MQYGQETLTASRSHAWEPLHADGRAWNHLLGAPALSAAELQVLAGMARHRCVAAGESVFTHDQPARALVFVREGHVALGYRSVDGAFRVERPVAGPGWLDQSAAWLHGCHAIDARAVSACDIVELPHEDLQRQLDLHPLLARRLITGLAKEVQMLETNTHGLMHKHAPARFAQWLADRCKPQAGVPGRGTFKFGQHKRDVASQLAITPETLSRLLRSLSQQGIISVAGYTVQVLDMTALRRMAAAE